MTLAAPTLLAPLLQSCPYAQHCHLSVCPHRRQVALLGRRPAAAFGDHEVVKSAGGSGAVVTRGCTDGRPRNEARHEEEKIGCCAEAIQRRRVDVHKIAAAPLNELIGVAGTRSYHVSARHGDAGTHVFSTRSR